MQVIRPGQVGIRSLKIDFLRMKHFFIVILFFLPVAVFSQEAGSCAENLKNTQTLFEKGQIDQIPVMLSECMKSGFTNEEEITASKLIIQTYLLQDSPELADSAMLRFLQRNPEYQLSSTDHSSFVYLFNTYWVKPVLQIGIHIGTNKPFINVLKSQGISPTPIAGVYNTSALNFFASVEAKIALTNKFDLNAEIGFSQLSFTNIEEISDFGKTTYEEKQQRIELPVSITYNVFSYKKITPYLRLGFGPSFILSAGCSPLFESDIEPERSVADLSRNDSRLLLDFFCQGGLGFKYKISGGYINFETRFNYGVRNQTVRNGSSSGVLDFDYLYTDDDFCIHALNFSFGYTYILYKPQKIK